MRTLRFLLRKEFLQIFRDRTMLRLMIAAPVIQLLVLSNAASFEVREASTYVVDLDNSTASRGLVQRMVASGRFEVADASPSMELADQALLSRDVSIVLRIPPDFERHLTRAGEAPVQVVLDAEDGAGAAVLQSYVRRIIADHARELTTTLRPDRRTAALTDPATPPTASTIDVRTRGWYNDELRYYDYMVPGILVLLVTIVATSIAAMNVVREKEIGTLEQLNVTPVTRAQLIASKLLPFWIIALVDLGIGLLVARLVFDIPMRGSLLLVFFAAVLYLFAALGIGLWISTIAETQQQAMFISFAINMVYLLMSGLFTPIQSMPVWAQAIAELSPVKHFIVIMRAVLVRGADLAAIQAPLIALAAYGAIVLMMAARQYSKTTR